VLVGITGLDCNVRVVRSRSSRVLVSTVNSLRSFYDARIASAYYDDHYFGHADQVTDPDELDHDLLILWGGEDISPSLYGEPVVASHAGSRPSMRDETEMALAKERLRWVFPSLVCAVGISSWVR